MWLFKGNGVSAVSYTHLSKKIALFYSMEMLIVLAVTILAGIFCGKWGYEFLISLANDLLNIHLLSVVDFDSFYIPYINKVTWNPYTTAAFVVRCV